MTATQSSLGWRNRKCNRNVHVLWFISWQAYMVRQKYCLPSSPVEINIISPSSAVLPCKDRQERLWQDSMVVAVLQAALALFPLGLRFVYYPFLNLKGNHAFGGYVSIYCIVLGGKVFFPRFEVLSVGRTVLGRSWYTLLFNISAAGETCWNNFFPSFS